MCMLHIHIHHSVLQFAGIKCRHYYVCCRDGMARANSRPRLTTKKRPNQRASRKSFIYRIDSTSLCHFKYSDHSIQLNTFTHMMKELQSVVTPENTAVLPFLKHVNSLLHNAILTCKAALSQNECATESFKNEAENIAPGKKPDHQWRFKPTSKPPGRKRKGMIFR